MVGIQSTGLVTSHSCVHSEYNSFSSAQNHLRGLPFCVVCGLGHHQKITSPGMILFVVVFPALGWD